MLLSLIQLSVTFTKKTLRKVHVNIVSGEALNRKFAERKKLETMPDGDFCIADFGIKNL